MKMYADIIEFVIDGAASKTYYARFGFFCNNCVFYAIALMKVEGRFSVG